MAKSSLRVVVLCCDGLYQRHLIRRAAEDFDLVGIVLQTSPPRKRGWLVRLAPYCRPLRLLRQLTARLLLPRHDRRGDELRRRLFDHHGAPPQLPEGVPVLVTTAINEERTVAFLRERAPEIVLVNGTQLLRQPVLALLPSIRHGSINLHTGLSPYSRGANCNLYMILEGHPELVGVTVHHIDAGIDSGDIILSAQVPMQSDDNFETIDVRSFHVGIELLLEAARRLEAGSARRVPQWEQGKLFLRRTGYDYEPWQRLMANRRAERGLIRAYLAERQERDRGVRLVQGATS
jgi:methionyl-tRNA formyltransferase